MDRVTDTGLLDFMIRRIPGLKGEEYIGLVKQFDKEDDFSVLSKKDVEALVGRVLRGKAWTMPQIRSMAEKDAASARKLGIRWVSWRERPYPPLLREISDPPALLFYRGVLSDPGKPLVAVVGTRKPSSRAAARAYDFGRELGEAGFSVVSGLALGIDAMAHRGNIDGGAPTVAVLGSSPDCVYPASNRNLARRILETGGLIVSEYPPETGPRKWHFPARNRIIAGMARGTLVVEAPDKSGSLITARLAAEYDRDLWADGEGLSSPRGKGMARFVEDGAGVINRAGMILAEWNMTPARTGASGRAGEGKDAERDESSGAAIASSMAEHLGIKL